MKQNMAHWDRALRLALGLLFGLFAYSFHWAFYIVAAVLILTAAFGYCPLYHLMKKSTLKKK